MFWFLPLLVGIGGLIGYLGGYLIEKWVIPYLEKKGLKRHIQEQKKRKYPREFNDNMSNLIKSGKEKGEISNLNIGIKSNSQSLTRESSLEDNSQSLTRDEIIDILVDRYDYERAWLVDESLERLQIMLKRLEKTPYTSNMGEVDWVLEDEESRRLFAGKYYNGEVVSMEEIEADEIDPELQWELDTQEIVIL